MEKPFWFYEWIDDFDIQTPEEAFRIISSRSGIDALVAKAESAATEGYQLSDFDDVPDASVVAGRAVDLSAVVGCPRLSCQIESIETLFRSSWHFFDSLIVEGPSALRMKIMAEDSGTGEGFKFLARGYAETLLHIRNIGGEKMLYFQQKPFPCPYHWDTHLEETGLGGLVSESESIISTLQKGGEIVRLEEEEDGTWSFEYRHPLLGSPMFSSLIREEGAPDPRHDPLRAVTLTVFKHYAAWLVADVRLTQLVDRPLGASFHGHGNIVTPTRSESREAEVAINLPMPALRGVPISEILRFREDEVESFQRFRKALIAGIKEQIKAYPEEDPVRAARRVEREIIQPAISDISQRVESARKIFAIKNWVSVGVGTLATSIGLVTELPFLMPAGIAATLAPAAHYFKYLEDNRDVKLSDMYFLWDLQDRKWEFK